MGTSDVPQSAYINPELFNRHYVLSAIYTDVPEEPAASNLKSDEGKFEAGRTIAQAVSRRLPTAAARVQTRVWSCGIL
jgi:hypothetical protein